MKIAQINMVPYGSTGKIMLQISKTAQESGIEARSYTTEIYAKKGREPRIHEAGLFYYGSFYENMIHSYLGKLLGRNGHYSYRGTKAHPQPLHQPPPSL